MPMLQQLVRSMCLLAACSSLMRKEDSSTPAAEGDEFLDDNAEAIPLPPLFS